MPREPYNPPLYPVLNLGEVGLVKDLIPFELPANAWNDLKNIRMTNDGVESFLGEELAITPAIVPRGFFPVTLGLTHYWVYVGNTAARVYDGGSNTDISPTPAFTGTDSDLWVGTVLNDNLVITNGVDEPHYWNMSPASPLAKLPGWPAGGICQFIVAFKHFLIALNVQLAGSNNFNMVKWSHEAVSGMPTSWDETDPTLDAGENLIGEETARLIGAQDLRDTLYVFSEGSMYGMSLVAGSDIFRFFEVSQNTGLVARRAVTTFEGQQGPVMAFLSNGDLVYSDGQQLVSMVHHRIRDWLFKNIDQDNYVSSVLLNNRPKKELWLGFPINGESTLTHALVCDYDSPTLPWSVRELPANTRDLARGVDLDTSPLTWANLNIPWSSASDRKWGDSSFNATQDSVLIATDTAVYKADVGNLFEGATKEAVAERTSMNLSPDNQVVEVTGVRLSANGQPFEVTVGTHMEPGAPVQWGTTRTFTPGQDYRIDARSTGRLAALRLRSLDDSYWRVKSVAFEYWPLGDR